MELIRGLHNLREQHRGCAVTIGNFDGVHLGHQYLIDTISQCKAADQNGGELRSCVVSFEPLPVEYFVAAEKRPHRITSLSEKISVLNSLPLDQLLMLRFHRALAETSAQDFIKQVLIDGLGTQFLLVGDDFQFGRNREGTIDTLKAASEEYGFELQQANTFELSGQRVSSTRIRALLADGELQSAAELLGRSYSIRGRVEYGAQLGRTIGFPTANIALKGHNPPLRGVFAVTVDSDQLGQSQNGIANIGVKPTVQGVKLCLEVHLLDFAADLYGQKLRVSFQHKLRDEKKFSGIDELKAAIATDEQNARQWFLN